MILNTVPLVGDIVVNKLNLVLLQVGLVSQGHVTITCHEHGVPIGGPIQLVTRRDFDDLG